MPSNLPSSFASAAAGQNSQRDGRNNNSGEWSRTGRPNGTLTFRRPSTTPNQSISSQPAPADAVQSLGTTVELTQRKYTKEDLLNIYESGPSADVSSLFVPGWNPGHVNGSNTATRGWGKSGESHVQPQEPDLCWDPASSSIPSSLREMTEEERDIFTTDVNSPVKPPPQNKDGNALNGGRKTSVSHGASLASPSSASRPGTRRRETTDTNPYSGGGGLISPTSATREGSSFWLRKNDAKEAMFEEPEGDVNPREQPPGQNSPHPFAGLVRNNTATGVPGLATASSLWGSSGATNSPGSALGSFGNFALPGSSAIGDKRPGGQSRLARLIPKDSNDNMTGRGSEPSSAVDPRAPWRPRQRTDTDPFAGEENLSGSAVLGGAQDTSPPPTQRATLFDTPVKGSASEFGMSGLNLGGALDNEPLSPSETNPYRSPPGERGATEEGNEGGQGHGLGLGGPDHVPAFGAGGFPRPFGQTAFEGSDRSQTSSVGAKPLPPISTLSGWPTSATPDRERNPFGNAFGNSLFSPMGDLHSPSLGNLSGVFGPVSSTGIPGSGSIGRGSKLGSLFPPAMQSQMANQDNESLADSIPDVRMNTNPLGAIGRNAFGEPSRNTDSPIGTGRGGFGDLFNPDNARSAVTSEALSGGISAVAQPQGFPQTTGTPFSGNPIAEPPSAQPRSMVMPDRMRWVYLDPQGHQQGPFTGLEMNDWYKANFFTADLRVKRVEDPEFEPLGQLIRRIGNSREPFLVPMMGIPHGPPAPAGPFSPSAGGGIVPPLNGVFPQFGRTLTAQEQNDLERRKQEEQYMMAQHRDLLSNQQRLARVQLQGHPGLHHHSSAHSLQSQPSFGSINSPIAMPPQPPIGSVGGAGPFLGANTQQSNMTPGASSHIISDMFRDDELSGRGPGPIGSGPSQAPVGSSSMESFRARLPQTQELLEDDEGFRGRLEEFEQLRAQHDAQAEQTRAALDNQSSSDSVAASSPPTLPKEIAPAKEVIQKQDENDVPQDVASGAIDEQMEQEHAAASARSSGLPMPFPPPQSSTPLPAPAPQRVKSNLPEQYATSSRSETPENVTQPPPLAPWAKDPASEAHRGPSLKEIQEAEARKAAKAEEAAAAARRVMAEQEAAREREKMAALASGLPTTSTWGTSSPASATSPWTMPTASKVPAPGLTPTTLAAEKKKTLADIQREEEARKHKAREIAVQSGAAAASGAKRYADLASKPNAPSPGPTPLSATPAAVTGAGWATVGAGGKVKVPTGPAAQSRSVSSSNIKPAVAPAPVARPVSKPSANTSRNEAMDEFTKWVQGQLLRGGVAEVDVYTQTLLEFPAEASTIADVVYEISKTMNGREFANEFIRRKKLAEKGVFEKQGSVDVPLQPTGGWNEVAKKNPHKENNGSSIPSDFKVVPARKKGKK